MDLLARCFATTSSFSSFIDERPTRGADDPDAPRSECDAEVETQRREVGAEEFLETRAGRHQVEHVPEGLWLAG